jgi:hypothetical protein
MKSLATIEKNTGPKPVYRQGAKSAKRTFYQKQNMAALKFVVPILIFLALLAPWR